MRSAFWIGGILHVPWRMHLHWFFSRRWMGWFCDFSQFWAKGVWYTSKIKRFLGVVKWFNCGESARSSDDVLFQSVWRKKISIEFPQSNQPKRRYYGVLFQPKIPNPFRKISNLSNSLQIIPPCEVTDLPWVGEFHPKTPRRGQGSQNVVPLCCLCRRAASKSLGRPELWDAQWPHHEDTVNVDTTRCQEIHWDPPLLRGTEFWVGIPYMAFDVFVWV